MSDVLQNLRSADPPWYVLGAAAFAVLVLPGGIPLTLSLTPAALKRYSSSDS